MNFHLYFWVNVYAPKNPETKVLLTCAPYSFHSTTNTSEPHLSIKISFEEPQKKIRYINIYIQFRNAVSADMVGSIVKGGVSKISKASSDDGKNMAK